MKKRTNLITSFLNQLLNWVKVFNASGGGGGGTSGGGGSVASGGPFGGGSTGPTPF